MKHCLSTWKNRMRFYLKMYTPSLPPLRPVAWQQLQNELCDSIGLIRVKNSKNVNIMKGFIEIKEQHK